MNGAKRAQFIHIIYLSGLVEGVSWCASQTRSLNYLPSLRRKLILKVYQNTLQAHLRQHNQLNHILYQTEAANCLEIQFMTQSSQKQIILVTHFLMWSWSGNGMVTVEWWKQQPCCMTLSVTFLIITTLWWLSAGATSTILMKSTLPQESRTAAINGAAWRLHERPF